MARSKIYVRLAATCLIASIIPSASATSAAMQAAQLVGLLPRASTGCSSSGYVACNEDGLPGNFCCPAGESCYVFNSAQSVICCPPGKDCSSISTISCDIGLQNATSNPTSPLFTTQLQTAMNSCGTGCCPGGMSCKNGQTCVADPPSSSSLSHSSATSIPSSTNSSAPVSQSATSSPTASDQASATTASNDSSNTSAPIPANADLHHSEYPTAAILVGFFSGLVTGIILTALLICCFGRSRKSDTASQHSDFSNLTANISDPIYQEGNSRADFLRRESKSRDGVSRTERVKSFFRTPTVRSHKSQAAILERCGTTMTSRTQRSSTAPPKTPSTLRHQASGESITIYSPPNLHGAPHHPMPSMMERNTTVGSIVEKADARSNNGSPPNNDFEKMLAEVGWRTGQPYLGSPGMVDPRSRRIGEV